MNNKIGICRLCLIFVIMAAWSVAAQPAGHGEGDATRPPCGDCHVCESPTKANPCLEMCLYSGSEATQEHTAAEGPGLTVLNKLHGSYGPVSFNHRLHAEMVGMGDGCATCHHYSPSGKVPPCGDCHSSQLSAPQSLRQPSLKGAYHRQCMGCHREWSHDTKCVVCHANPEGAQLVAARIDSTDILGASHPVMTIPDTKVWTTPYKQGPVVTLHHQEHIDLFGLRCVDCHKSENCGYCHDLQKEARVAKTDTEIHAVCNDCHRQDRCGKCHDHKQKPAFSHTSDAGWPLSEFHQGLKCRACHPTGRTISKLSTQCSECHGGWDQTNFRHAVTGLQLDDLHGELDCGDCHENLQYGRIPKCSGCHDDCRNHEDAPPGDYVRQLTSK